ncbi:YraN family protein [Glutamicibacter arilaitensis]|uniref:YraN family protein n=1 Tax=Glutamicibacter arilaitensis TaxID=256701 RepID=UPI00384D2689
MKNKHQVLGDQGEQAAVDYLTAQGYTILERNWRCKSGELDLVAADADGFVLAVEVKTRTSARYGTGFDAITPAKYRRLQRLLIQWGHARQRYIGMLRIDIVEVRPDAEGFSCEHHEQVGA